MLEVGSFLALVTIPFIMGGSEGGGGGGGGGAEGASVTVISAVPVKGAGEGDKRPGSTVILVIAKGC